MSFVCPECARSYEAPGHCTEDGASLNDNAFCPLLGQSVGSYRVATLIGQGGMGEVYRGVHPEIGSRVAIKVLSTDAARAPGLVERFFAEARAVNVIRHEGIVSVLDLSRLPDGRPYIIMEYLEGAPLSGVLKQYHPMPLGGFLQLMFGVTDALSAAHSHGITHRDLKPDNIFVTAIGRTKLLDFGIAKLRPEIGGLSDATRTGALLGTPFYMSPEQARGQPIDHRSDLYSLGIILFEGATGRRPFEADNLFDQLRQNIEALPPRPRDIRPDVPAAFEAVLLRALEKDPAARFQSVDELAHALRETAQFLPNTSFVTLTGQPSSLPRPMLAGSAGGLTAPGYSATLTAGRTELSAHRPKRSIVPWIVLSLVALGGVGLMSAVIALVVFGDNDTITIVNTPVSGARGAPRAGSNGPPSGGVINLRTVDPVAFLPKARELAKKEFADAALSTITIDSPTADGKTDLTDGRTVVYAFVSPKAANGEFMGECSVWVTLAGGAPEVTVPPMGSCMVSPVPSPRCSVKSVLQKAGVKGKGITLVYGPTGSWTVTTEDGDPLFVPDNC